MPNLVRKQALDAEVVHHYEPMAGELVTSKGNIFTFTLGSRTRDVAVPVGSRWKSPFLYMRWGRRALRLDKGNAVLSNDRSCALIAYQGALYRYDLGSSDLVRTGSLENCRNMLHQSILAFDDRGFLFGEYGRPGSNGTVRVLRSDDGARSFKVVHRFEPGSVRHIHGVYRDPQEGTIWTLTGDFEGECRMVISDLAYNDLQVLGDGTQSWRAVSLCFLEDEIVWGMDSPLEPVHVCRLDRSSWTLNRGVRLPGPVWYTKALSDGGFLFQTSCERGPGCTTRCAHLFYTDDFETVHEMERFRKDWLPHKLFKHGVLAFADGEQTSHDFALFGEGLRGFDGRSIIAAVSRS